MDKLTAEPFDDDPCSCSPSPSDVAAFRAAMRVITGKWKIEIITTLSDGPLRFGELRRALPGVTQHVLTAQLRELARSGLLLRTAHADVPPRVFYELTEAAYALQPVYAALIGWAHHYGRQLADTMPADGDAPA